MSGNLATSEIGKEIPVRHDENPVIQELRVILSAYKDVLSHQSFFHKLLHAFPISLKYTLCRFYFDSDFILDDEINFLPL